MPSPFNPWTVSETLADFSFSAPHRAEIVKTGEREPISFLVRQLVYRRDNWTCQRCGAIPHAHLATRRSGPLDLDHIVPWSAGGSNRTDNLRTLCSPCNKERSNFINGEEKPSTPIVRICAPCAAAAFNQPFWAEPDERITVYCGSRSHISWTIRAAQIL